MHGPEQLSPLAPSFLPSETLHSTFRVDGVVAVPPTSFVYTAVLGLAYGILHVIGPDHLGTLMALSVASTPRRAFSVGAAWSFGHCVGMVAIALILVELRRLIRIDIEAWEHMGDYAIGCSLMLCGMYFIARESQYLQEGADGSVSLKPCEHCNQLPGNYGGVLTLEPSTNDFDLPMPPVPRPSLHRRGKFMVCSSFNAGYCDDVNCSEHTLEEGMALLKPIMEDDDDSDIVPDIVLDGNANRAASLLGVFQGLCCPMGLVGIAFLANLPTTGVITFLLAFLFVSVLGTGIFAYCWSMLMRGQGGALVSSKVIYRFSCWFTILLGLVWVIANADGMLESLNYAEQHERGTMPALGGIVQKLG